MVDVYPSAIIILSIIDPKSPTRRDCQIELKYQDTIIRSLGETHF